MIRQLDRRMRQFKIQKINIMINPIKKIINNYNKRFKFLKLKNMKILKKLYSFKVLLKRKLLKLKNLKSIKRFIYNLNRTQMKPKNKEIIIRKN